MARDWFSGVSDQELLGAARGKDASLPFHTVPTCVSYVLMLSHLWPFKIM